MRVFSPFRIVLSFIILAGCSLLAIPRLNVGIMPPEKGTTFTVSFGLAASSPAIVERQVTAVLENALSKVTGTKSIRSVSNYNGGQIWLTYDKSADFAVKQFEITSIIREIYPLLPNNASYPIVSPAVPQTNENNNPLLIYTIRAPYQLSEIRQVSEQLLVKKLVGFTAVQRAELSGIDPLQIVIRFDIDKCRSLKISPDQIITSLQSHYTNAYMGTLDDNMGQQYFLRIYPAEASVSSIENTIITRPSGLVRVKDIAIVSIEEQEAQSYFRINGQSAINLTIFPRRGENAILLSEKLRAGIHSMQAALPAGYEVHLEYDDAEYLRQELGKNYKRGFLSISILTISILLSYRKWRYLLILLSSLAVSLSLTLLAAYVFKVDIHLYTIAGIAIAFGIMTDNAIVMVDYYHQFRNRKVFLALLAATLTTVSAAALIFFLPNEEAANLSDFATIIILAVGSSIVVSLWFTPAIYQLLLKGYDRRRSRTFRWLRMRYRLRLRYGAIIRLLARYRLAYLVILILIFGLPAFLLPARWEGTGWYHLLYNNTIGSDTYQQGIRPVVNKWLGGSLRFFTYNIYERSGYRTPEKTMLIVDAQLPVGNTVEQMNFILSDFEKYLSTVPGVSTFITNIYSGQQGEIQITFKEGYENSFIPRQLKSRLIARSIEWGGVQWDISGMGQGFSNSEGGETPNFRVTMKGYNYDELERQADILAQKLRRYPRVQKINSDDRPDYYQRSGEEYVLTLDRQKMAELKADQYQVIKSLQEISRPSSPSLRLLLNGIYYPIVIKEKNSDKYNNYDIQNIPLRLDSSKMVRIKDIGSFDFKTTVASVYKEDRQYIRIVSFNYMGLPEFGNKYLIKTLDEMKEEMPLGYTAKKETAFGWWGSDNTQTKLIILLLLLIFFYCSVLFESLRQPFFIITMIPLSFIGLFLVFGFGQFYFDQGGYAAFIMLGGLVASASIYIINDLNNLRRQKRQDYNRLITRAAFNRSRTILITTISTSCGLIPFLMDGEDEVFWFSFALGTLGGLLFSLIAIFFVLPVLLYRKRQPAHKAASL
jgi:multidrug efflux pump subunit AcrB